MPHVRITFWHKTRVRWAASLLVSLSLHVSVGLAASLTAASLLSRPFLEQQAGRSGQIELTASMADWSQPLPMPEVTIPPPEIRITPDHAVMADRTYRQASTSGSRPTPTEAAWVERQLHRLATPELPRPNPVKIGPISADRPESLTAPAPLPRRERVPQIETAVVMTAAPTQPGTKVLGSADIRAPQPRFDNRPPYYPPEAIERGWEGAVELRLHLSADGAVTRVDVVKTSGLDVLDAAAANAARSWRFEPALRDGRAVATAVRQSVRFRLQ